MIRTIVISLSVPGEIINKILPKEWSWNCGVRLIVLIFFLIFAREHSEFVYSELDVETDHATLSSVVMEHGKKDNKV